VGHTLSLAVRATDSVGTTTGYAGLIGPVGGAAPLLVSTVQPAISGAAGQGTTVKVGTGTWRPRPMSFSYQWARCDGKGRSCAPISGATLDSHEVGADDLGHTLVAIVQARSGATLQAVFSAATGRIGAPVPVGDSVGPSPSAPPLVAQVIQEGKQLAGGAGSWSGSGAVSYAYQWYRCDASGGHCRSIHGATKVTYMQVAGDVGKTLGLAVRASDGAGTASAYANLVGPVAGVAATLVSTGQPGISGTGAPGQTVQVSGGSWSQVPTSFSYQWQRCNANGRLCAPIAGATSSSYAVVAADSGHTLLALVQPVSAAAAPATLSTATAPIP
jgi:hypothetical protein